MKPNPRLLDPSVYPHSVEITTRFSDVDQLQHLNNSRLAEFYQEARLSFYQHLEREHGYVRRPDSRLLVAHLAIDYLAEVHYPHPVTMRVGLAHIGRTSMTLAIALFSQGRCCGLAKSVMVYIEGAGPAPLPDDYRGVLQQYLMPAELFAA
jgi:acyl-CoA thioester hydrolase